MAKYTRPFSKPMGRRS